MSKNSSKVSKKNKQGKHFRPKFAQKSILVSEFWKSNCEFRISSSKVLCVLIFRQNRQFWFFSAQTFPKMNFGVRISKTVVRIGIRTSKIPWVPIFAQGKQLWIFRPKFRKLPNYMRFLVLILLRLL